MDELDDRVRWLLEAGDVTQATTLALTELGPEILGYLSGVLGDNASADEVFSELSFHLWKSFKSFKGRCAVKTWLYILAHHEIGRFVNGKRKRDRGRVPISELQDVLEVVRSRTRPTLVAARTELTRLRAELPIEDRMLLILRMDRQLSFNQIALLFAAGLASLDETGDPPELPNASAPELLGGSELKRESARLRKRYELVKKRLIARLRELSPELLQGH